MLWWPIVKGCGGMVAIPWKRHDRDLFRGIEVGVRIYDAITMQNLGWSEVRFSAFCPQTSGLAY